MHDEPISANPFQSPLAELSEPVARDAWPAWVRVGLWKIRHRFTAWMYLGLALALLAASAVTGFWPGFIFLGSVYWYWEAIQWVDEFGQWG